MRSEFESREAFECIFGDEIDLSKDETGEYSFQPSRFAYSFFLVAWDYRQSKVDELQCEVKRINLWYSNVKLQLENKEIDSAIDAKKIDELQKQVDAVKGLAQTLWEKSEEKHQQSKVWESKTLGECADEILEVWQAQQEQVEALKAENAELHSANVNMLNAKLSMQKRIDQLEMNLRFVIDHFVMNDLDKAMPRVFEEMKEVLRGES